MVCVCECSFPWRLEEGIRYPGAGSTGSCESPDEEGSGNWTWVLCKSSAWKRTSYKVISLGKFPYSLKASCFSQCQGPLCPLLASYWHCRRWSFSTVSGVACMRVYCSPGIRQAGKSGAFSTNTYTKQKDPSLLCIGNRALFKSHVYFYIAQGRPRSC